MMTIRCTVGSVILVLTTTMLVGGCSSANKKTRPLVAAASATHNTSSESTSSNKEVFVIPQQDSTIIALPSTEPISPAQITSHQPLSSSTEEQVEELFRTGLQRSADFTPTLHYDLRKPQFVMIHHTSQNSIAQTIRTFQLEHTKVSSHYIIGRDGQVVQMLNDYQRAWHAGAGKWGNITDMNSVSIGIELDNNGSEPFPDAQINSLLILLQNLKSKYRIPQNNFIGHSDYAPGRKDDPSTYFPWEILAERGFGIWYNPSYLAPPPATFNSTDALRIIGYDVSNLRTAVRAFKKKFIRTDLSSELTPYDIMVLYDLYRKYY